MRAPNHIAGGIVFTATFASFWNVNIFSDWKLIFLTVFASLLPDIDHTRSIIGKLCFPVAKWIDRKYGHRTITHSLLFFAVLSIIVYLIEFHTFLENIFLVFNFAFISHLLLDMLTVQGIPLFYPFKRNPCVIPADPNIRIKGGSSQEIVVFGFFILILSFSYPLFQNGFWNTYNNQFATVKHLNSSNRKSNKILEVNYAFTDNSNLKKGNGLLVYSDENKAIVWKENTELIEIRVKAIIEYLEFKDSSYPKYYKDFSFEAIDSDSLNQILNEGIVIFASINSDENFIFEGKEKKEATINYYLNPKISVLSKKDYNHEKMIELKESEILYRRQLKKLYLSQKNELLLQKETVSNRLKEPEISDYTKERLYLSFKEIEGELAKIKPFDDDISKLESELNIFKKTEIEPAKFYGKGRILKLAKESGSSKLEASL
jgi:inner membrane protein